MARGCELISVAPLEVEMAKLYPYGNAGICGYDSNWSLLICRLPLHPRRVKNIPALTRTYPHEIDESL
jgi:hypothetical protein